MKSTNRTNKKYKKCKIIKKDGYVIVVCEY